MPIEDEEGMRFEVHMAVSNARWEEIESIGLQVESVKQAVFKDYREMIMRNFSNPRSKRDFPLDNFVPVFADSYKAVVLEFLLHNARSPKMENEFFFLTARLTPSQLSNLECINLPTAHFLARAPHIPSFTRKHVVKVGVAEQGYIDMRTVMSQTKHWAVQLNQKRVADEILFLTDKIQHYEDKIVQYKQRRQHLQELDKDDSEKIVQTPKKIRTFSFDVAPGRLSLSSSPGTPSSKRSLD